MLFKKKSYLCRCSGIMVNLHISMEQTQSADEDYLVRPKALKQQSRLILLYQIRSLQNLFARSVLSSTTWLNKEKCSRVLFSANYKGKHTLPCTFLYLLFGWSKVYSVSPTNALGRTAWRHISGFVPYFSSAKMGNLKRQHPLSLLLFRLIRNPQIPDTRDKINSD